MERRLAEMVGDSRLVYKGVVEVLRAKWATNAAAAPSLADCALCTLRRHLLMLLVAKRAEHLYRCAAAALLARAARLRGGR